MAKRLWRQVVQDYPEYVELHSLLALAAKTWPQFGISASQLAELDDLSVELIRILVDGR